MKSLGVHEQGGAMKAKLICILNFENSYIHNVIKMLESQFNFQSLT